MADGKRNIAKELLIPKMAPLLLLQLFGYGIVLLVATGVLVTKYVRPGLATFGIKIVTTTDTVAEHDTRIEVVETRIGSTEKRLVVIEKGIRILVMKLDPPSAALLPPPIEAGLAGG